MQRQLKRTIGILSTLIAFCLMAQMISAAPKVVNKATIFGWTAGDDVVVTSAWDAGADPPYLFYDSGSPPSPAETATYNFIPSASGLYDVFAAAHVRNDGLADAQYEVSFKSGGSYELNDNQRRASFDTSQALSGLVTVSVDLVSSNGFTTEIQPIHLGRYEMDAGTTNSLTITTDGASGSGFMWAPTVSFTGPQVANADLVYEETDATVVDYDKFVANWVGGGADYYWGFKNGTFLNMAQGFFLPASDRTTDGTYRVDFQEVYGGATDQFTDLPVTVYFEAAGTYTAPSVGGMVTSVDESNASGGYVTVDLDSTAAGTTSIGEYEMLASEDYMIEIPNHPTSTTGFIRKFVITLTQTSGPSAVKDWVLLN